MYKGNQVNPLANNIRFLTRHIISELLTNPQVKDEEFVKHHIEIIRDSRRNKRADGKFETNYNNVDLFLLCGNFNPLNIEKLKKNSKNGEIFDKLFVHHLQDLQRFNAVTQLFRKLVLEFLQDYDKFHHVLKAAKRSKEEYPKQRYESVNQQIQDCLKQAARGVIITNVQQEKRQNQHLKNQLSNLFLENQIRKHKLGLLYLQQHDHSESISGEMSTYQISKCRNCQQKDLTILKLKESQNQLIQQVIELRRRLSSETLELYDQSSANFQQQQQQNAASSENMNILANFYNNQHHIPLNSDDISTQDNRGSSGAEEELESNIPNHYQTQQQMLFQQQLRQRQNNNSTSTANNQQQFQNMSNQDSIFPKEEQPSNEENNNNNNTNNLSQQPQNQGMPKLLETPSLFGAQSQHLFKLQSLELERPEFQTKEDEQQYQELLQRKIQQNLDNLQDKLKKLEEQPLFPSSIFDAAKQFSQTQTAESIFQNNSLFKKQQSTLSTDFASFQNINKSGNINAIGQDTSHQTTNTEDNIDYYLNQQYIDFNNFNNIQINAAFTHNPSQQQKNQQQDKEIKDDSESFQSKFGINLDDKVLNQFCKASNSTFNDSKEGKLHASLLIQLVLFLNQVCQNNVQTSFFKQYPIFNNIKNVIGQIISDNFDSAKKPLESVKEPVKIAEPQLQQGENKESENNKLEQLNEQQDLSKEEGEDNQQEEVQSKEQRIENLKQEFESYKQDFKNAAEKTEGHIPEPQGFSETNCKEELFKKAIMHRKLGKIFDKMGKMSKALENQLIAIQSFVKASGKSYDPTTIYWLYEMAQIAQQLPVDSQKKKVYPLIFSHVLISYRDLQKNVKLFKQTNYQGVCVYYLAITAKILGDNNFALKLLKNCLDLFTENKEKSQVLSEMAQIFKSLSDFDNYCFFQQQAYEFAQKAYSISNPNYLKSLLNLKEMEKIVQLQVSPQDIEEQNELLLQAALQKVGKTFIQNLSFSDLCEKNQLYCNAVEFKKKAVLQTTSRLEIAFVNQEIAEILFKQQKYEESLKQYALTLNMWNQYFISEIKILKEQNKETSYLAKMMELKRAQIRSKQAQIEEHFGNMETVLSYNKKIQSIQVQVLGHFDAIGLELINKIDKKCKDLFIRERYYEQISYGQQSTVWLCDTENANYTDSIQGEVVEAIITIYNRFYLKQLYGCVNQKNMQNMISYKKMKLSSQENNNLDLQQQQQQQIQQSTQQEAQQQGQIVA